MTPAAVTFAHPARGRTEPTLALGRGQAHAPNPSTRAKRRSSPRLQARRFGTVWPARTRWEAGLRPDSPALQPLLSASRPASQATRTFRFIPTAANCQARRNSSCAPPPDRREHGQLSRRFACETARPHSRAQSSLTPRHQAACGSADRAPPRPAHRSPRTPPCGRGVRTPALRSLASASHPFVREVSLWHRGANRGNIINPTVSPFGYGLGTLTPLLCSGDWAKSASRAVGFPSEARLRASL